MSDDRKPLPEEAYASRFFPYGTQNHGLIGASAPMRAMFAALPRIAASSSPLLIGGEPGTGKGMLARTVHDLSDRGNKPFVIVDCTVLPGVQLRGTLSDALLSSHGGTLVLDGIGNLSPDLQALLLRILRTGEFNVPGEGRRQLDTRIVSITDADLEPLVESGRIREALYYRLNLLSIKVPPLRERGRDVQLLADFFFTRFTTPGSRRRVGGFAAEARLAMQQWSWPGNVRELVNRVRGAIVMCEQGPLCSSDLGLDRENGVNGSLVMTLEEARDAAEFSALLAALSAANGELARIALYQFPHPPQAAALDGLVTAQLYGGDQLVGLSGHPVVLYHFQNAGYPCGQ